MSLHNGDRAVGPLPDRLESGPADFGRERVGADDEHGCAGLQLFLQQPGRALGAGDYVVWFSTEAHRRQMLGDFRWSSRSVVGDVQSAGTDYRERLDGAGSGFMATEDGAVEIEQ